MKKLIVSTILFWGIVSAYSQSDSLLLKNYEQKIIEISKLKNDLLMEKQNFAALSDAYKIDTLTLQKQINDLLREVTSEKEKVTDLNKNKIKLERDKLLKTVDSLNALIVKQNQIIADKDIQITNEKTNTKITADKAKNDGKAEVLASIVNLYKNRPFDDLLKSSTQESVTRDMQLVGNNPEVTPVLNDLQIYFNALKLISEKFDAIQIENAHKQLSQIKRQSKLFDALKEDVEFYKDFNDALKETISTLIDLDKHYSADGDSESQKLKFNKIVTILTDYIYNYYGYNKYPYLSEIVVEIIKRKQPNADADITDLLKKIE